MKSGHAPVRLSVLVPHGSAFFFFFFILCHYCIVQGRFRYSFLSGLDGLRSSRAGVAETAKHPVRGVLGRIMGPMTAKPWNPIGHVSWAYESRCGCKGGYL